MPRGAAVCGMMLGLGLAALAALPARAPAQDGGADARIGTATPPETEAEKREREGRRLCAVALCGTLHTGKPAEGPVSCSLQKTWRREAIDKALARGKISWPWGNTRCVGEMRLDRKLLVKAMQEPELEMQLDAHTIHCQIENGGDKYEVVAQLRPRIRFKQGKATEARLNWGRIEAPALAKSALWSITAADNTFGLLRTTAVDDINSFIGTRCMEVKEEWQGR
jgi:hypothetical protein